MTATVLARRWIVLFLLITLVAPAFVPPAYGADALSGQGAPAPQNAVQTVGPRDYRLQVSSRPDRSNSNVLRSQAAESANMHVFVAPIAGIRQVRYWLDPKSAALEELQSIAPFSVATIAPFDMRGANAQGEANALDTHQMANGPHRIVAAIEQTDGAIYTDVAEFVVQNGPPALVFDRQPLKFQLPAGGSIERLFQVVTTDGAPASFKLSSDVPWLSFEGIRPTITPESGVAGELRTLQVNTADLAPGEYTANITATADGFAPATAEVKLQIKAIAACSPVPCNEVLVTLPYNLTWSANHGKILDANGIGTGFTWIDQPTVGTGYIPANLVVDTTGGVLRYTTTAGIMNDAINSQDNALAVGIDAPSQVTEMRTTVLSVPAGTGNFEQAGLWFGNNQDNYVKLEVISWSDGMRIEYAMETGGVRQPGILSLPDPTLVGASVQLALRANPGDRTITAYYGVNGAPLGQFGVFTAPGELFSFDAAGIDPAIGTRSFGGIFATHRNGPAPITYTFGDFSVTSIGAPPPPSGFFFDRVSYPIQFPSAMTFGPDGRLYVVEFMGTIHALTLNANKQVIADEVINTIAPRLALGIAIDPASTAGNVMLWISHSSPAMDAQGNFLGEVNSGMVTKLSGPGFATRQDVITGLPRALANHATNSIHFGPDGKLYIAQGGNTGAGAPNNANTEFGTRAEQPLSAAFLMADVNAPGFDGTCATPEGSFGPAPCSVTIVATGLRNMYDFVFHSNGQIYGPDNGLGVTGTYPPQPSPVCTGLGNPALYTAGGNNPGSQPDDLNRIVAGKYYGHPNPYRNECVFKSGSYQGVAPLATYMTPMFNLGASTSSNGIVEYKGLAFGGALQSQLLIANYSVGDNIVRVRLSADGLSAVEMQTVVAGLVDPLPLLEGPDGTLYVGEFGAGRVTALIPARAAAG